MKKIIKIFFKTILVFLAILTPFIIYCSLNTSPDEELINAFLEAQSKYSGQIKNNLSILIDYRKPVLKKRLWVIDNSSGEVWLNAHVGHSFKSGLLKTTDFSNIIMSEKTSIGCFITGESYSGPYGFSMRVIGMEKGINDNALRRGVVFHGQFPPSYTKGCFATFPRLNKEIIEMTKNGSLVLVYK